MPDIITHYLFGKDVIEQLDDSYLSKIIKDNKELFFIGCQGPDPLFYNDFLLFFKEKKVPKIGNLLHKNKTGKFFIKSLKYLKDLDMNSNEFKEIFSYITGFMCHYALDKNAHPYIFYHTGIYNKNIDKTYKYRGNHKRLEVAIDTILLKEKLNKESKYFKVHKEILSIDNLPKSIDKMFSKILFDLYNIKNADNILSKSYKDCRNAFKVLRDPYGLKKIIFNVVDKTINKKSKDVFSNLSYFNSVQDNIDYMNTNKKKWYHPCYKDEKYNLSFYEILEISLIDVLYLIENAYKYINDKVKDNKLNNIYKDLSYSTGKPTDNNCKMKYFDSIIKAD